MKTTSIVLLGTALLVPAFTGCYGTTDGHLKPGIPAFFATDTMNGRYNRSVDQVFSAAKAVLISLGTLTGENTITKVLEAQVDGRTIWVKVEEDGPGVTRERVQARKSSGAPDRDWAAEIDKQVALKLAVP